MGFDIGVLVKNPHSLGRGTIRAEIRFEGGGSARRRFTGDREGPVNETMYQTWMKGSWGCGRYGPYRGSSKGGASFN